MSRSGFWLILLCTAAYGVLHSALAAERVKAFIQQRVSTRAYSSYRLAYNLVAGVTLLPLAALVLLLPDRTVYRIPAPWVFLTLALQAAALLCLFFAFRQSHPGEFLGVQQVGLTPRQSENTTLMTAGFYRLCRHPLYFFGLLLIWLFPIMTWNLLALFLGFTLYILIGSRLEERRLVHEYGEEYRAYMRTTPWLIPNPLQLLRK